MAAKLRIEIDEDKCVGCGSCIGPCVGGALQIVDGKCKVISDELCDGMGVCLGICPTGALQLFDSETGQPVAPEDAPFERMKAAVEAGLATKEEADFVEAHDPAAPKTAPKEKPPVCFMCGTDDTFGYLIQVAHAGQRDWVCTHCLPRLIHG